MFWISLYVGLIAGEPDAMVVHLMQARRGRVGRGWPLNGPCIAWPVVWLVGVG